MPITHVPWPRSGRISVAAHDVAVALLKGAQLSAETPEQGWDALDTGLRVALLNIAESALMRALWLLEDHDRPRFRPVAPTDAKET